MRVALLLVWWASNSVLALTAPEASAEKSAVKIAVATNFKTTLQALTDKVHTAAGYHYQLSAGSSGKLYAQIRNGAPFSLFFSADQKRPALLYEQGLADAPATYATGSLLLVSASPITDVAQTLNAARRIAIANPQLAPYGAAASQALSHIPGLSAWQDRLVLGTNIGTTFAMVASRAADTALVAATQRNPAQAHQLHIHRLPTELHAPIHQDMAVLPAGRNHPGVRALIEYLTTPEAHALLVEHGYQANE